MKTHHILFPLLSCTPVLTLQGGSLSSHPVDKPAISKASGSAEMERLIDQPGPIQLETINNSTAPCC